MGETELSLNVGGDEAARVARLLFDTARQDITCDFTGSPPRELQGIIQNALRNDGRITGQDRSSLDAYCKGDLTSSKPVDIEKFRTEVAAAPLTSSQLKNFLKQLTVPQATELRRQFFQLARAWSHQTLDHLTSSAFDRWNVTAGRLRFFPDPNASANPGCDPQAATACFDLSAAVYVRIKDSKISTLICPRRESPLDKCVGEKKWGL